MYVLFYIYMCVCTVYRIPMYRQAQSLCYHSCLSVILQNPQDLQKGSELRVIQGAIDHQNPTGSRALQVLWVAGLAAGAAINPLHCNIRAVPRLSQRQVKASRETK